MRVTFIKNLWIHLIRPYWTSEDKWAALALLGGYLALMGGFIALSVRLNYLNNDFVYNLFFHDPNKKNYEYKFFINIPII